MPVLIVYGMPSGIDSGCMAKLIFDLQMAVVSIKPSVKTTVSVFFPVDIVQHGLGEELVCFIEALSGPSDILEIVAKNVLSVLGKFAKENVKNCNMVQIIAAKFNHGHNVFICNPREQK